MTSPTIQLSGPDPLALGGLSALLGQSGIPTVSRGADVWIWDLGPTTTNPEAHRPPLSADVPLLALVHDDTAARTALALGASGVLERTAAPQRMVAAIHALAADLIVLDDGLAAELLTPGGGDALDEPLTPREAQVLELLAEGASNPAIARALDISPHTAKFHVQAILAKLGARNRADAAMRAARLGLVRL